MAGLIAYLYTDISRPHIVATSGMRTQRGRRVVDEVACGSYLDDP